VPWGVAAAVGAAVVGGVMSNQAAKKGAAAQTSASNAAINEQAREFDQTQANQQPFLQAGQNAVNLQQQYLAGDTSGFQNSPDYQFAVQQGFKGANAQAAGAGNVWGGGTTANAIQLGQGLATQYANNYWNKLAGMAGQGQTSATSLGNQGQAAAGNIGNYLIGSGQANASSYAAGANSFNNTLGQVSNIAGQYYQNNPSMFGGGTGTASSYSNLGNTGGNYWSDPSLSSGGNYNFAAMSGGG
jgi:hypothetical protein